VARGRASGGKLSHVRKLLHDVGFWRGRILSSWVTTSSGRQPEAPYVPVCGIGGGIHGSLQHGEAEEDEIMGMAPTKALSVQYSR